MNAAPLLQDCLRRLRDESAGAHRSLGDVIHWLDETGSTNDDCRRLTEESGGRSIVVLADRQSAGRGQYGRTWQAPAALGVLMSFSPPGPPPESAVLTAWASVAVAMMLERRFNLNAAVKWPNDVLVGGRKIAGVLVEVHHFAVVGIGLNVLQRADHFPPDCRLPPTSIALETNTTPDRAEVVSALLGELESLAAPSLTNAKERIYRAWGQCLDAHPGDRVTATLHDASFTGRLLDLHPRDGLRLHTNAGVIRIPGARLLRVEPADRP